MNPVIMTHIAIRLMLAIPLSLLFAWGFHKTKLTDQPFWKTYLELYALSSISSILLMPLFVDL